MAGYGPVALYAGGSGEVRFKDVAFKDLMRKNGTDREGLEPLPDAAHQRLLLLLVRRGCRYQSRRRSGHRGSSVSTISVPSSRSGGSSCPVVLQREYASTRSDMIVFAHDFTGDGWPDIVSTFTNGRPLALYVNPKGESRRWDKYEVLPSIGTEVAILHDVDGDGMPDLVYGNRNGTRVRKPRSRQSDRAMEGNQCFRHRAFQSPRYRRGRYQRRRPHWTCWRHPDGGSSLPRAPRRDHGRFIPADFGAGGAEMSVYRCEWRRIERRGDGCLCAPLRALLV